ncbi:MAG: hypothetical protein Q8K60_06225, partial [Parachlamydiaceae bacterium]|nr:hypothetical protein [Parachlamydiaceae bacterium]
MQDTSLNLIHRLPSTEESDIQSLNSHQVKPQEMPTDNDHKGVSDVFKKDTLSQRTETSQTKQETENVEASQSWLKKLLFKKKENLQKNLAIDTQEEEPLRKINHTPILEKPEEIGKAIFPLNGTARKNSHTIPEIESIIQQMSEKTIDQIMRLVINEMLGSEKDDLITTDQMYEKYNHLRKNKNNVLKEIKEAIYKDESLASYVKPFSQVAQAASFLCMIAATAVMFGVHDKIADQLKEGLKNYVSNSIKYIAAAAPTIAVANVGTKGFEAYINHHKDEEEAKMILNEHGLRYYDDKSSQMLERVGQIAGNDFHKKMFGEFIKQNARLIP